MWCAIKLSENMKILLAFALVAAVAANPPRPEPIQLAEAPEVQNYEEPSMMPLFVPQEIIDAMRTNEFAELPQDFVHPLAYVEVAEEPTNFADVQENDAPSKVRIADQPEFDQSFVHPLAYAAFDELPQPIQLEDLTNAEDQLVNDVAQAAFAELPQPIVLENPTPEDQAYIHPLAYSGFEAAEPVKFADNEAAEEAPTPVKIAEQPSDLPLSPIQFVDLPLEADFQPQDVPYPPKVYDNAMLR